MTGLIIILEGRVGSIRVILSVEMKRTIRGTIRANLYTCIHELTVESTSQISTGVFPVKLHGMQLSRKVDSSRRRLCILIEFSDVQFLLE